jgi:hypothetical protein
MQGAFESAPEPEVVQSNIISDITQDENSSLPSHSLGDAFHGTSVRNLVPQSDNDLWDSPKDPNPWNELTRLSKEEKSAEMARRKEERKQVCLNVLVSPCCICVDLFLAYCPVEGAKEERRDEGIVIYTSAWIFGLLLYLVIATIEYPECYHVITVRSAVCISSIGMRTSRSPCIIDAAFWFSSRPSENFVRSAT